VVEREKAVYFPSYMYAEDYPGRLCVGPIYAIIKTLYQHRPKAAHAFLHVCAIRVRSAGNVTAITRNLPRNLR